MGAPRKYSLELRERAVESRRPIRQVARDLGNHREALRVWVRQAEADSGRQRDLLTSDEREELKRLRKENRELQRANAILEGRVGVFHDGARPDPAKVSRFVEARREVFGVEPMCRAVGVPVHVLRAQVPEAVPARDQGREARRADLCGP